MKYILILFAFLTINGVAQIKIEHGLTTGWGKGSMSGIKHNVGEYQYDGFKVLGGINNYSYNGSLGYKFRLKQSNSKLFYDADITLGIKKYSYIIVLMSISDSYPGAPVSDLSDYPQGFYDAYSASLALSCNYLLFKKLYAGIGIAPYYRYRVEGTMPSSPQKFDIPVFARIGYDFRFIDVSFVYKLGVTDMMKDRFLTSGRINDWQLQVFVPF